MILHSDSNPYKKLLESDDQFFDFSSDDIKFNKDYLQYQQLSPFYDKERYINSQNPEFENGFVEYISNIIILFYDLFEEKKEDARTHDESFATLENSFSYSDLDRQKKNKVISEISNFIKKQYIDLKIKNIDEVIDAFLEDTDVLYTVFVREDVLPEDLHLTYTYSEQYEVEIHMDSVNDVELDGNTILLSEVRDYLRGQDLDFLLNKKENIYLENSDISNYFLKALKKYVEGDNTLYEYIGLGGDRYPVVIDIENLKREFKDFIDNYDDIVYDYLTSDDNTIWEEE